MIRYKIDVIQELNARGLTSTKIRDLKLLPGQTYCNIKAGKSITLDTLNKLCLLLRMQPGDIIEVVPTDEEKLRYF